MIRLLLFKEKLKKSLIGGLSGALETIAAFILGIVLPPHNLALDFILGGITFTVVGTGIILSLIISNPRWKEKRKKLLLGGIISGFIAGLFFHFGIGLYFGIIIFSFAISFLIQMLRIVDAKKIFLGGVIGGFIGSIFASFALMGWSHVESSYPIFQNQLSIFTTIINTAIIIYFLNLGILLFIGESAENKNK